MPSPHPPACIVFDLDGTLVDSREDLFRAVRHLQRTLDVPELPRDGILAHVGRGARHLVSRSLPEGIRTEARVEEALGLFRAHYAAHLADHTRPYPGVEAALADLSDRLPLAVLTNKPGHFARDLLERLGLNHRFAAVLGGGDVPALKPDPAGLVALLQRLGARPEHAWYVGDMPLDVTTGRAAGCRTAAVAWGLSPREALAAERPERILERADALPDLAAPPGAG